jgi:hypothetical protein
MGNCVKVTAFIVLGLGTARFLQGLNSIIIIIIIIIIIMTMNTSLSIATRRPTVEPQLPLAVGYREFRPNGKKVQSMMLNIGMTTMQEFCKPWRVRRCHSRHYLPRVLFPSVLQKKCQPTVF